MSSSLISRMKVPQASYRLHFAPSANPVPPRTPRFMERPNTFAKGLCADRCLKEEPQQWAAPRRQKVWPDNLEGFPSGGGGE